MRSRLSSPEVQKTISGCAAVLGMAGFIILFFFIYGRQGSKYPIMSGQPHDIMMANAQGALESIIATGHRPEHHVAVTIKTIELAGSELRVSVMQRPKTPGDRQYFDRHADLCALEWASRIAMAAPAGVMVRLILLDETGKVLSRARRAPGNKYFTHAELDQP